MIEAVYLPHFVVSASVLFALIMAGIAYREAEKNRKMYDHELSEYKEAAQKLLVAMDKEIDRLNEKEEKGNLDKVCKCGLHSKRVLRKVYEDGRQTTKQEVLF